MILFKRILHRLAWLCRVLRNICDHWLKIVIVLCILSPISPHVRLPYQLTYSECGYIGTRWVIHANAVECPLIAIVNTRTSEIVSW